MVSATNNNIFVCSERLQKKEVEEIRGKLNTCYAVLIALGMLLSLPIIYPFVYKGLVSKSIFGFLCFSFGDVAAAILLTACGDHHRACETFPHTSNIFKQIRIYQNLLKISNKELEYLKKEYKSVEMNQIP